MDDITHLAPINNNLSHWLLRFSGRQGTDLYPGKYEV
jgi:hypothetical protein